MELPKNVSLNEDAALAEKLRNAMAKNGGPNLGLVMRRLRPQSAVWHANAWQVCKWMNPFEE